MTVLEELKTIVCSPIKPTATNETANKTEQDLEDIPSQFTKVLGKGELSTVRTKFRHQQIFR